MSTPIVPPYVAGSVPIGNITPFTYRDGLSYLARLERMVKYINRVLIPWTQENYDALAEAVINNAIELQDIVLYGIIDEADSGTRQLLDTIYAPIELEETVDSLETSLATVTANIADKANLASPTFTGGIGLGATPSKRIPVDLLSNIDGDDIPGSTDKVGFVFATEAHGDFTGDVGINPGFLWGLNVFTKVQEHTGLHTISNLIEVSITETINIDNIFGLVAEAAFLGSGANSAHVDNITSMRVAAPKRKDGATGGTADTVYGLFVENVQNADLDAAQSFALFVEGGVTRLNGRLDLNNDVANAGDGALNLQAGYSGADGAVLSLQKNGGGGGAFFNLQNAGAAIELFNGASTVIKLNRTGQAFIGGSSNLGGSVGPVLFLNNITTAPVFGPDNGGVIYVEAGALKYRGTGGTVTTLGAS